MKLALAEHNALLSSVIEEHLGKTFKTVGDSFCVAFQNADMAALAAMAAHARLAESRYRLSVRIGIHTGMISPTEGDYYGPPVNKVARIQSLAVGGQTLASGATKGLLDPAITARFLGTHHLKDLLQPTDIWQLGIGDFPDIRSLGSTRNNLPVQNTSFIGRVAELAELRSLLPSRKLITLTGAGGTGKSRLALQVAAENLELFPDGIWFVELAPLLDREQVLREILQTLKVQGGEESAEKRLLMHLEGQRALLILDNCEHVLDEVIECCELLLSRSPTVSILATSREPLGASGEKVYAVPSLGSPKSATPTLEELAQSGSTALFLDRLSAAAPNHRLDRTQAATIRNICAQLDGIPLAIELAAARGRSMSLQDIEKRLSDRFRLLTGGSRNAVSRQQTLRAMIDWSVRLLTDPQRKFFTSLSVFAGGCYLDSAEDICASDELDISRLDVLDLITALVDKSLVVFEPRWGRYHLLESMRHYALEQLENEPWAASLRERHARFYLAIAESTKPGMSVDEKEVFRRFFADVENYRSAIEWLLEDDANIHLIHDSLHATWNLWHLIRRLDDYYMLLQKVAARGQSILSESQKLETRSRTMMLRVVSHDPEGEELINQMLAEYARADRSDRPAYLSRLSYCLFFVGRTEEAVSMIEPELETKISDSAGLYHNYGNALAVLGRYEESISAFDRAARNALAAKDWLRYQYPFGSSIPVVLMTGRAFEALDRALDLLRFEASHGLNFSMTYTSSAYAALAVAAGETWFCALAHAVSTRRKSSSVQACDPFDLLVIQKLQELVEPILDDEIIRDASIAIDGYDWQPWLLSLSPHKAADLLGQKPFLPHSELLPPRPSR